MLCGKEDFELKSASGHGDEPRPCATAGQPHVYEPYIAAKLAFVCVERTFGTVEGSPGERQDLEARDGHWEK